MIVHAKKRSIKLDQLLRVHGLGERESESISQAWAVRVSYYQLYYYFRPGKVYWLLWILYRKSSIAIIATIFYSNPSFQLAFTILILFSSYVLQVRSRPYMSEAERLKEVANHDSKVEEGDKRYIKFEKDLKELKNKKKSQKKEEHGRRRKQSVWRTGSAQEIKKAVQRNAQPFFFDYNTVELILLACAIFICAAGIMFTSGKKELLSKLSSWFLLL